MGLILSYAHIVRPSHVYNLRDDDDDEVADELSHVAQRFEFCLIL